MPFTTLTSYATGVNVTEDPALPPSLALLTFRHVAVTFVNSTLQQVSTDLDAVFGLYNSSVSIVNSHFPYNTAKTSGAVIAQIMLGVSIDSCTFEDNKGDTCSQM